MTGPLRNLNSIGILLIMGELMIVCFCSAQNETIDIPVDPLELWEPPEFISKNYAYYLAGHDEEGRPIWIMEAGKWDMRRIVEMGQEAMDDMVKYSQQQIVRINKSIRDASTTDNPVTTWAFICDADGYDLRQLSSVQTVAFVLRLTSNIEKLTRNMEYGFIINLNYFVETMVNIVRPILGQALARTEILGTNKAKYIPVLLKKIPRKALPEWYGGHKDFSPIAVYG